MKCGLFLILSILGLLKACSGSKVCGNGHNHTPCSSLVDAAIQDVELYFDNHLCHTIMTINCDDHHITGDEVLCGTDGKTYDNHCLFTLARCAQMHDSVLHIASKGVCPSTTAAPTTMTTTAQMMQSTQTIQPGQTTQMMQSTHTMKPMQSTQTMPVQSTTMAALIGSGSTTVTPDSVTSATEAATTVDIVHGVIAGVFCQQAANIDCNTGFNIVCGSDGQYYPNDCELTKAKCFDLDLVKVDNSQCVPGF